MTSPSLPGRGERLARRYPMLRAAPEAERPAIMRAVLLRPIFLIPLLLAAFVLLPQYLQWGMTWLGVPGEASPLLFLAKIAGLALVPVILAVAGLRKFALPRLIRQELIRRGYHPDSE